MSDIKKVLRDRCNDLKWDVQDLARESGVPRILVDAWWKQGQDRKLTHRHAFQLAFAFVKGYLTCDLVIEVEEIVNELLEAAALGSLDQPDDDQIWRRICTGDATEHRTLSVGYVECPLIRGVEQSSVVGPAANCMEEIAWRLNVRVRWVERSWDNIIESLLQGELDMICPILPVTSAGMSRVRFSEPVVILPGALASRWNVRIVEPAGSSHPESATNVVVHVVRGDPGLCAARVLLPRAFSGAEMKSAFEEHESAGDACLHLRRQVSEASARHCLIVSDILFERARMDYPELVARDESFFFLLGFAAHPKEKELIRLIDVSCRQAHMVLQSD